MDNEEFNKLPKEFGIVKTLNIEDHPDGPQILVCLNYTENSIEKKPFYCGFKLNVDELSCYMYSNLLTSYKHQKEVRIFYLKEVVNNETNNWIKSVRLQ